MKNEGMKEHTPSLAEQLSKESKAVADRLMKESEEKTSQATEQALEQLREATSPENVRKQLSPWIERGEFGARFSLQSFKAAFLGSLDLDLKVLWKGEKLPSLSVATRLLEEHGFYIHWSGLDVLIGWYPDQVSRVPAVPGVLPDYYPSR